MCHFVYCIYNVMNIIDFVFVLQSAIDDFSTQPMTVILSPTQLRDCVRVPIVDDSILDPNEVFNVELTTGTPGVVVRPGLDLAQVTINDNDERKQSPCT